MASWETWPASSHTDTMSLDRVIREIPLASIDGERWPFRDVLPLVTHLQHGGSVPPIHVQIRPHGRYRLLDGRHRVMAFRLLGRRMILARYSLL